MCYFGFIYSGIIIDINNWLYLRWKKNKYQKLSVGTGYKNVEEMKEGFKAAQKKHRAAMEKLSGRPRSGIKSDQDPDSQHH